MKAFMLVQRIARSIGDAIHRQYHRQIFFRHRHGTVLVAMDDGNRRAPIALTANAPVAQPPSGFFLAQTQRGQVGSHCIDRHLESKTVVFTGIDGDALQLIAVPVGPGFQAVGLVLNTGHLLDGQVIFLGKFKIPLVMRWHAHDCAVAIAHQHIVADPDFHLRTRQRMRDEQARALALFLLRRHFGFSRAAGLAFGDESGQFGIRGGGMQRQRMLGCDGAKCHAHDGVSACGEDIHPAIANQRARRIRNSVGERKAHAFTFADPVFLHQAHPLGPAVECGLVAAHLHMVEQLLRVVGDLEVIAWNLALFDRRAGAPALAVDDLFVGQHSLVHRIPVHDLGLAVGDAFFQHLQEQPLVPLVVTRIAGRDFTTPVNGQPHRLHLLFHVSDVVVSPLGRRHAVFQRGILGRQAKRIPAHRHQDVVALHAQVAGEHVVDGVVAHMAHVQLAAGVRQHGAGVVFLAACVFGHAVGIKGVPVGLRAALYVNVVVFVLHEL